MWTAGEKGSSDSMLVLAFPTGRRCPFLHFGQSSGSVVDIELLN